MEVMSYTERLLLVRPWNQLSGNGQRGWGLNEFPQKGCLIRAAAVDFFTWNVFVELRASLGHAVGYRFILRMSTENAHTALIASFSRSERMGGPKPTSQD
jgi:hypothetical protein